MTKRRSIADSLRAKGFPPLSEDAYQDNIRALVPTVCFCEETAMTTDLSNKSVKQLRRMAPWHDDLLHDCVTGEAADELARRLEEAQKLLHDLPRLIEFYEKHAVGPKAAPSCLICGKQPIEVGIRRLELPEIVVCKTCIKAQQQLDRYTRRSESGESLADHYDTLDALQEAQQQIVAQQAFWKEFLYTWNNDHPVNVLVERAAGGDFSALAAHDAKIAAEAKAEALEEAKAKITDAEYFFPKDLAYLSKKLDEWAAEYRAKIKT